METAHQHHHHTHHHHHHHTGSDPATGKRIIAAIVINLIFVAGEFYLGFHYGSVGLLADAGHNASDVAGLLISLIAFFMLKKHAGPIFTYGHKKATVLAAFINSVLLIGAVGVIIYESIEKLLHGSAASGTAIMITAGIGIAVNGFTVVLLSNGKEHDLNVKSAYLHMLADTMVSCGVVISGALIMFSQWTWIDPLIGLFIAGLILRTSWSGFRESIILILDGVQLIGTLKALGADNRFVRRIFLTQAALLIGKGILWGNIIGLGLAAIQYFSHLVPLEAATYYVSYVPIAFDWIWIVILNILTVFVSLLILLLPSMIVTQISPAKVMHFE